MKTNITAINENIHKITTPYKDIFTTVCTVKTQNGVLLFDSASFEGDVENYIIPMLEELGTGKDELKYVFISHDHKDHSGDLLELLEHFPDITVLSRSKGLKDRFTGYKVYCPEDGEEFLDVLKIVTIPGHTADCMALLDTRTNTLLTGDCLQLYGIFGSQDWGSNIGLPVEYLEAVEKVRRLDVGSIYTAHDYHPCGTFACTSEDIGKMLDACVMPIERIRCIVKEDFARSVEDIRALYNSDKSVPPISTRVAGAVKDAVMCGKM